MQPLPEHLTYRIDSHGTRQAKSKFHPNGHWDLYNAGQNIDYSDPRTFNAPTIFEQRAVLEALRPTLSQIHKEYGLQIDSFDLRCTPDGYNAAWAEVKRRFERFVIDKHGVENTLLKDGKLKDESKLMKLERWYGLITEYRFARNWPYMENRKIAYGRLVQNPDAFACVKCRKEDLICHGHRERLGQRCDFCEAANVVCSKETPGLDAHIKIEWKYRCDAKNL